MLYDYLSVHVKPQDLEVWIREMNFQKEHSISLIEFVTAAEHFSGTNREKPHSVASFLKRISDSYLVLKAKKEETTLIDYNNVLDTSKRDFTLWDGKNCDILIAHVRQYLSTLRNARKQGIDGMSSVNRLASMPLAKNLVASRSAPNLYPSHTKLAEKIRVQRDSEIEKKVS